MRKEWIQTDEERQSRELKRLYKQGNQMEKYSQISLVKRKKNRLQFNQEAPREQPINAQCQWGSISRR
jgi:hypothetical protein